MIEASVNNVSSFTLPNKTLLQSHFFGQSNEVYTPDFPRWPALVSIQIYFLKKNCLY